MQFPSKILFSSFFPLLSKIIFEFFSSISSIGISNTLPLSGQIGKKGEYVLHREKDTIRPPKGEMKFKPFVQGKSLGSKDGYLIGGDYTVDSKTNRLVHYK